MKKLIANWEKITLIALLIVFFAQVVIFAGKIDAYNEFFGSRGEQLTAKTVPESAGAYVSPENIMSNIDVLLADLFAGEKGRDIFSAKRMSAAGMPERVAEESSGEEPDVEVVDIKNKPLPIEYMGKIVFDDGRIVAQVNVHRKSYLVEDGTEFGGYSVESISPKKLVLRDSDSRKIELSFREILYSEELMATVKERSSQKVFDIYKDSSFLGFKVLDIAEDYVLVSNQGQHLKLWKGRVQ